MALYSPRPSADEKTTLAEQRFAEWVYVAKCTFDTCTLLRIDDEDDDDEDDAVDAALQGPRIVQRWLDALGDEPSLVRALVAHG